MISFNKRWLNYIEKKEIPYKIIDFNSHDIIGQLHDCDALLWHFHQGNPKEILFAKQLLYSLQIQGKKVFPDFYTVWHFDDKVGQKYLLEAINAPLVPTWIFYDKKEALQWIKGTDLPKVFKLRVGAGSQNVLLVNSRSKARRLINKAFGRGFPAYNAKSSLRDRWRRYKLKETNFFDLVKGIVRFVIPPKYSQISGQEKGYIYFQEYIKGNDHDIRIVVIGDRAFALKRMVRDNDFRASGSGHILYDRILFDESTIKLSFSIAKKIMCQSVAFDFIYDNGKPLITEISYGFVPEACDACPGYWDKEMIWHEGEFDPYGWMVEDLIR